MFLTFKTEKFIIFEESFDKNSLDNSLFLIEFYEFIEDRLTWLFQHDIHCEYSYSIDADTGIFQVRFNLNDSNSILYKLKYDVRENNGKI